MSGPLSPLDMGYVLCAAMRYQLPRRTYGSGIVADALIAAWPTLVPSDRTAFVREIIWALDSNKAGDTCDREAWQRVLDHAASAESQRGPSSAQVRSSADGAE